MTELKPCPACGSKIATPVLEYDVKFPQLGYVRCREITCGLKTGLFADGGRHAVEIWNSIQRTDEVLGVWKRIERDDYDRDIYYECSVCHTPFTMLDGTTPELNDYHYCPNCGAKMEVSE